MRVRKKKEFDKCLIHIILFLPLLCFVNSVECVGRRSGNRPSDEFAGHKKVRVELLDGRDQAKIECTSTGGKTDKRHLESVTLVIKNDDDLGDEWWTVDLMLNKDLVPGSYFEKYQQEVRIE